MTLLLSPHPEQLLERDRSNFFLRQRLEDHHLRSSPASHILHSVKEPADTTGMDRVFTSRSQETAEAHLL